MTVTFLASRCLHYQCHTVAKYHVTTGEKSMPCPSAFRKIPILTATASRDLALALYWRLGVWLVFSFHEYFPPTPQDVGCLNVHKHSVPGCVSTCCDMSLVPAPLFMLSHNIAACRAAHKLSGAILRIISLCLFLCYLLIYVVVVFVSLLFYVSS